METSGLPGWHGGRESACQCRRRWFVPGVRKTPWSRKWQPTPVFLPGESHGQRSLAGYSPWGHRESDTTDPLTFSLFILLVEGAAECLRQEPTVFSPAASWGLKSPFYFLQTLTPYFLFHFGGQRKPSFWQQHFQCRGSGFDLWLGSYEPTWWVMWLKQNINCRCIIDLTIKSSIRRK